LKIFFCFPKLLNALIPKQLHGKFLIVWNAMFKSRRLDCFGTYQTLHKKFLKPSLDTKTIITRYTPKFEKCWNNLATRHQMIEGKEALKVLRNFYRENFGKNLSQDMLIEKLIETKRGDVRSFIESIFHHK